MKLRLNFLPIQAPIDLKSRYSCSDSESKPSYLLCKLGNYSALIGYFIE